MIDDLHMPPEESDTIHVANKNSFLFMHDNASCHKTPSANEVLVEYDIPAVVWPATGLNSIEKI